MPRWLEWRIPAFVRPKLRLPFVVAFVAVASIAVYTLIIVPRLQSRQKVKTIAAQIEENVPAGETVYAVNPDFQPFLFYVHRPLSYVDRIDELPDTTNFFLVRSGKENDALTTNAVSAATSRANPAGQGLPELADDSLSGDPLIQVAPV